MNQPAISREDLIISDYREQTSKMEKLLRRVTREYEDSGEISDDLVYDIEYYIRGVDGP